MQVLHELHPICKGNGNQNVFLLHIWLMDVVDRNATRNASLSGVWSWEWKKAASAAYHVQMAMFCHNNYVNASV